MKKLERDLNYKIDAKILLRATMGTTTIVPPDSRVVEGGGGLGGVTEELLALNCQVTTFEPNDQNYEFLRGTFSSDALTLIRGALVPPWHTNPKIVLNMTTEPWNSTYMSKLPEWATLDSVVEVNAFLINEACRDADVLVLDVEGFEANLLQGWDFADLTTVICEWHTHLRDEQYFKAATVNLKEQGFQEILSIPSWYGPVGFTGGRWVVWERFGNNE